MGKGGRSRGRSRKDLKPADAKIYLLPKAASTSQGICPVCHSILNLNKECLRLGMGEVSNHDGLTSL